MNGVEGDDTFVVRICAQFETLLARFAADCRLVENAEFNQEETPNVEEARAREQSTINQLESALQQIGQLTTYTSSGALAKIRVIQCCLEYGLAADKKLMALVKSLARDLDKAMQSDPDYSRRLWLRTFPAASISD